MKYFHEYNIIYGNLNLGNISLDINYYPKITDFCASKLHPGYLTQNITQPQAFKKKKKKLYMTPEIIELQPIFGKDNNK